jgi:hypothetical protein
MALVAAQPVFHDGSCQHTALFPLNNTTAGDTIDVGNWFTVVKRAGIVSGTGPHIAAVATIAAGANGGPTLLTIPAGPNQDGIWLLVVGAGTLAIEN